MALIVWSVLPHLGLLTLGLGSRLLASRGRRIAEWRSRLGLRLATAGLHDHIHSRRHDHLHDDLLALLAHGSSFLLGLLDLYCPNFTATAFRVQANALITSFLAVESVVRYDSIAL